MENLPFHSPYLSFSIHEWNTVKLFYCTDVIKVHRLYTWLLYSQTVLLYGGGVVEMHRLILQLFNCWLSFPCNDKVANEETDDSGDDDDASNGDDDDGSFDWYNAGEDCALKCYPPLNDEELILVTIISRSKKLILKKMQE